VTEGRRMYSSHRTLSSAHVADTFTRYVQTPS
jgi:hypothetical protein